jgi:hypothetical protein
MPESIDARFGGEPFATLLLDAAAAAESPR